MHLGNARVVGHARVSDDYRVLRLECPRIAAAVKPGQFVHLRIPGPSSFVLRRPFSVFKANRKSISLLYKEIGRGTKAMGGIARGETVSLIGPLGNWFPAPEHGAMPVLVAGGYGVAPLYLFAERSAARGILFVGGKTSADVLMIKEFKRRGWRTQVATENGSRGLRGTVMHALDRWLRSRQRPRRLEFYACGPDGMLRALCDRVEREGERARIWVSMDRRMGCGVGACLACVVRVRNEKGRPKWARVCRDGPVFDGTRVVWDEKKS